MPFEDLSKFQVRIHDYLDVDIFDQQHLLMQDKYIFTLWFLLSFFLLYSSPNLSGRRLDVYHTSTRGVALV